MIFSVPLPLPPSANRLYKNVPQGGRAKSRQYRFWIEEAGYNVAVAYRDAGQPNFTGPLKLTLALGLSGRGRDIGNCLKAIEDLFVRTIEGWPDDRWNDDITIRRDPNIPEGFVAVTFEMLTDTS